MLIRLHSDNPDPRRLSQVVDFLDRDGLVIVPTDTVYSFACALGSTRGLDALARLKGVKPEKAQFSLVCHDLSQVAAYTKPLPNEIFKLMRRALPGPYTFILEASGQVPKIFRGNKKTIGIRVPDHGATLALVEALGRPLLVTSVHDDDEVDGGLGHLDASTVIDCTSGVPEVIREGLGPIDALL